MYRTKADFLQDWAKSSTGTLDVLRVVTDEALGQEIVPGHNSLGWMGWHVTTALGYFTNLLGFRLSALKSLTRPTDATTIADQYARYADEIAQMAEQFSDDYLLEKVDVHGERKPRGAVLRMMIDHQTHHRGQMTVLVRQAGLTVPGVMGPTKEQMKA
ncbi:DinB family protein [Exiguobacterium sp. SL-9]|uniref:DinB family protein n=1 Tax=Exiguobacterium sp. SL-9 TaxID=2510963 RepID=UPI001039E871|nr:DinB family protein [Exiguobacterium sp. SL-9]TCI22584.1 damage-inducible protein DinB [Exiguobacterium sp. SL-9]